MALSTQQGDFDHRLKILLVGDSGVGKSSILLRFTSDVFDDLCPTIVIIRPWLFYIVLAEHSLCFLFPFKDPPPMEALVAIARMGSFCFPRHPVL